MKSLYQKGELEKLRAINEQLAKRSNQRLTELEKHHYQSEAYKRATYYTSEVETTGKNDRFSRSKKMDIDDLYSQIKEEISFLNDDTSTISGEYERRVKKTFETLYENEIIDSPTIDKKKFEKQFNKFLESNAWKDIKKYNYYSGVLSDAAEAMQNGATLKDLEKAFDDYRNGEDTDIIQIWSEWIKIK